MRKFDAQQGGYRPQAAPYQQQYYPQAAPAYDPYAQQAQQAYSYQPQQVCAPYSYSCWNRDKKVLLLDTCLAAFSGLL